MANYRFDAQTKRVVRDGAGGAAEAAGTRFLVLRDGGVYFEGTPEEIANSQDAYLRRFLV